MNWLDWCFLALLAASAAAGFSAGFVKVILGSIALVAGFLGASWFYGMAAAWIEPYVNSRAVAALTGFLLIFIGALIAGSILGALIARMLRVVGLSWADRLLGGVVGLLRGGLLLAVMALLLITFAPRRLPQAVQDSRIAPYIFETADVIAEVTPYEIKRGFEQSYEDLRKLIESVSRKRQLELRSE